MDGSRNASSRLQLALAACAAFSCASYYRPLPPVTSLSNEPESRPAFTAWARSSALRSVAFTLPRGYPLGEFAWGWEGTCQRHGARQNREGPSNLPIADYYDVFDDAMASLGYPVLPPPQRFKDPNARLPDLQVEARIIDAVLNECFSYTGTRPDYLIGEAWLRVEWVVQSADERKVVARLLTEGTTALRIESLIGERGLWRVALKDAAERLARLPAYHAVVDPRLPPQRRKAPPPVTASLTPRPP